MTTSTAKGRLAWDDRFTVPTQATLIAGLPGHLSAVAEHVRAKLLATEGISEEVGWQGVWKWTFVYVSAAEPTKAWVYLVPDPSKLRISIPVPAALIPELPVKKLSKFVRDGLLHAPLVGRTKWPMWEVQGKGQVDDILELSRYKLAMLAPKPPTV